VLTQINIPATGKNRMSVQVVPFGIVPVLQYIVQLFAVLSRAAEFAEFPDWRFRVACFAVVVNTAENKATGAQGRTE